MITVREQAQAALAAKDDADHQVARLGECPPWRHAAFAGMLASLVVQPALPLAARFMMDGLFFLAVILIVRSDRRRLGVFINGYRRGKTRLVVLPLMLIWLALYAASYYFEKKFDAPLISVGLAVIAFVIGYYGSVIWQRVFRRELGA